MGRLLDGLRSSYDAIVVDSPPLAAGVDGLALATVTGSLVLVLRSGVSDRELAEAKVEVLGQLPVRVLGAVLNDVRPGGAYRYYSYYLEGYEVHDEPAAAEAHVLRGPAEEPAPR
jgi:Mrp family chromosome partitioning ATPase